MYELIWRNKWLTADCHSIKEIYESLEAAAQELRKMEQDGLILENFEDISDDYAFLVTENKNLAEKYDMFDREEFEDDVEFDQDDLDQPFEEEQVEE